MRRAMPGRAVRPWLISFAAFFLIASAWALASPYDGTPDEMRHVIRAAGVVQGQIFQAPAVGRGDVLGAYQTVPRGLVPPRNDLSPVSRDCYHGHPERSAACGPQPGPGGRTPVTVLTGAGRYNPLYYAAVGEPLVRWPDWTGVILARLISAALCAAFLASAWLSCAQWRQSPLMTGALFLAVTPAAFQLTGGVNPNAVEIAAGVCLAAAAIPLLLDEDSPNVRSLLRRASIAAIAIAQFRVMGPAFVVGWIALLLVPPVRARLRQLRPQASTWIWSAAVLVSCVIGAAWTVAFKVTQIGIYARPDYTASQALRHAFAPLPRLVGQAIDGFSYYDTRPPEVILLAWLLPLVVLAMAALAWGTWTDRWRLGVLIVGVLAIPVVSDLTAPNLPFQGRYVLPVAVGIPLLSAFTLGRTDVLPVAWQATGSRIVILFLLPFQLLSLVWVMDRWQSGIGAGHSLNPLRGTWHPVTGSTAPLLTMAAGLIMLGILGWHATRARRVQHVSSDDPPPPAALPSLGETQASS